MAISRIRLSGFELGSQALAVMVLGKLQFRVGHKDEKKGVAFTNERTETRSETRTCYNCNRPGQSRTNLMTSTRLL